MQSLVSSGVLGFSDMESFLFGKIEESVKAALISIQKKIEVHTSRIDCPDKRAEIFKHAAQMLLLLDRPEEADEYFTASIKQMPRKSRDDYNAMSCLFAGIGNLNRNHMRLASSCLQRALETKGASLQTQIESCAALAVLFFKLGMRRPAKMAADYAFDLAEQDEHDAPRAVIAVMRVEFIALNFLRHHPKLSDLAFWPRREEVAGELASIETVLKEIEACRKKFANYELLCERLDFLAILTKAAHGKASSITEALEHLDKMSSAGLTNYAQSARVELGLAAAAINNKEWLQMVLQPLISSPHSKTTSLCDNLEFEYCKAKLAEMQFREDLYILHYRKYTQAAIVQIRRACAYITIPHVLRTTISQIPKDDVATRLPGKYRRAYRFLLENLNDPRLSVRMIADAVGVTERSLQLTFRAHLAQSPSEVIRRCRMENIRTDLENGAMRTGSSLLDVASRWGVGSRSSLSHLYQAEFNETPRQTVEQLQ